MSGKCSPEIGTSLHITWQCALGNLDYRWIRKSALTFFASLLVLAIQMLSVNSELPPRKAAEKCLLQNVARVPTS